MMRVSITAILLLALAGPAGAQAYPSRPITLMVSTTAGAFLPMTPTLEELGIEVETSGWTAMVAPKDTPAEIVARVQGEFAKAAARAEIKTRLNDLRAEPVLNTPEDFRREWRAEAAMWERAIHKAGIKVQ